MSSEQLTPNHIDNHGDVTRISMEQANSDPSSSKSENTMDENIVRISKMALQIEQLFLAIKHIHQKVDKIQEENESPTGCGFSCSNNSLNM